MKERIKGIIIGLAAGLAISSSIAIAANTTTLYDVIANGVKIVIDGQKINPTDANGNTVEPIIYNGTTYLPVRAVANAFGKAVYWDGPNYTVYIGDMKGELEYPSKELSEEDNIGHGNWAKSSLLKDNYGNFYTRAMRCCYSDQPYEVLCNYKYSRLKGIVYIAEGFSGDQEGKIVVKTDGKTVYTSPQIDKRSHPIAIDVDITGCNSLEISAVGDLATCDNVILHLGEMGLYQ